MKGSGEGKKETESVDMQKGAECMAFFGIQRSGIKSQCDLLLVVICSKINRESMRYCVTFYVRFMFSQGMSFGGTGLVSFSVITRNKGKSLLGH